MSALHAMVHGYGEEGYQTLAATADLPGAVEDALLRAVDGWRFDPDRVGMYAGPLPGVDGWVASLATRIMHPEDGGRSYRQIAAVMGPKAALDGRRPAVLLLGLPDFEVTGDTLAAPELPRGVPLTRELQDRVLPTWWALLSGELDVLPETLSTDDLVALFDMLPPGFAGAIGLLCGLEQVPARRRPGTLYLGLPKLAPARLLPSPPPEIARWFAEMMAPHLEGVATSSADVSQTWQEIEDELGAIKDGEGVRSRARGQLVVLSLRGADEHLGSPVPWLREHGWDPIFVRSLFAALPQLAEGGGDLRRLLAQLRDGSSFRGVEESWLAATLAWVLVLSWAREDDAQWPEVSPFRIPRWLRDLGPAGLALGCRALSVLRARRVIQLEPSLRAEAPVGRVRPTWAESLGRLVGRPVVPLTRGEAIRRALGEAGDGAGVLPDALSDMLDRALKQTLSAAGGRLSVLAREDLGPFLDVVLDALAGPDPDPWLVRSASELVRYPPMR